MTSSNGEIIRIYGVVQGVGFRPFVSRLAREMAIAGSVANKGSFVEVYAVAAPEKLSQFRLRLRQEAPPRSTILRLDAQPWIGDHSEAPLPFQIIESSRQQGDIFVSPDIATCPQCQQELYNPADPRYRHPFINCTACGPRVTILDAMPYDRERTSMGVFPMCDFCHHEYTDPPSRRYDAQPVCCNQCGPQLYLANNPAIRNQEALRATRQAIIDGKIVAIKGIGGFHLACDARNPQAVARLRELKHRPAKPFAVMMRDLTTVEKECYLPQEATATLTGHQKPILLLRRRTESTLAPQVAPGNPSLGVMLPYAPVQMLIFRNDDDLDCQMSDALVMTSGNCSGAPICRSDEDALEQISSFCDLILSHDRLIRLRADDSVMEFFDRKPYMIRRSRGYAPLPFMLSGNHKSQVLGIGGELKNTYCPGKDGLFYPSPYIGDMADLRSVQALRESVQRLCELLEIQPQLVACDMHPGYNTSAVAKEMGLPVLEIQHHYAHILSCMAENDFQEPVLGVAYDGTGYGTDKSIWGGEIMVADWQGFQRVAALTQFSQPGGDASAREGWRIAAAMFNDDAGKKLAQDLELCSPAELQIIQRMAALGINTVPSTSAGRLFDAAAAVLGLRRASSFEGEAAMTLQFAAESANAAKLAPLAEYATLPMDQQGILRLPADALIKQLAQARLDGVAPAALARYFHEAVADYTIQALLQLRQRHQINTAALSGGVFQNTLLCRLVRDGLERHGFQVLMHSQVPPNDGGIALGQAAGASYHLSLNQK